ncbi:MAG: Ribonuclease VapC22 [Ignavibacteria bacterium]|nr:Ribonuclease VapC22 [Ignavibacteria bacterium]MBV6477675.1 Ribonuclease VapC22 [Ignavibacteria bacterium]
MILLDTHIWIWWISDDSKLSKNYIQLIKDNESDNLCISMISIWELTRLFQKGRLSFNVPLLEWIDDAIRYPGMKVLNLSKEIILHTTKLENFHKDPADQLIVSTSIVENIPLLTMDKRILKYKLVQTLTP